MTGPSHSPFSSDLPRVLDERESPLKSGDEPERSDVERLAVTLGRRYVLVLFAIAFLIVVDQLVIQPSLVRLTQFAPVINLSGRQRMLSQKITKAILALRQSPNLPSPSALTRELRTDVAAWNRVHQGLQSGDQELRLPGSTSPEIRDAFVDIAPWYSEMQNQIGGFVSAKRDEGSLSPRSENVERLLRAEPEYLRRMDRIVALFEKESQSEVVRLRKIGLSLKGGMLILLAGLGVIVVRPAGATIRRQWILLAAHRNALAAANDRLESRVLERTRQLSEANDALRQEMHQRQSAEEQSRQTLSQLAHVARVHAISHLATGIAHELNQPLGAINGSAEAAELLLERAPPDVASTKTALERIRKSAMRAGEIIRRMRAFLRPLPRDRAACDLNQLAQEVAELVQPECRHEGVQLRFEAANRELPIHADAIQIQQVLLNLVQNALRALREAPQERRAVTIRTAARDAEVFAEVEDTGPGFQGDVDLAFQAFTTKRTDGLGLGLSISQSIIRQHDGRIWIEADRAVGALVTFSLPALALYDPSDNTLADGLRR